MLTKSLHTITSATKVAEYVHAVRTARGQAPHDSIALAGAALAVLGYQYDRAGILAVIDSDPTLARIVANCGKILAAGARRAA
jgi:hypothetical protein